MSTIAHTSFLPPIEGPRVPTQAADKPPSPNTDYPQDAQNKAAETQRMPIHSFIDVVKGCQDHVRNPICPFDGFWLGPRCAGGAYDYGRWPNLL